MHRPEGTGIEASLVRRLCLTIHHLPRVLKTFLTLSAAVRVVLLLVEICFVFCVIVTRLILTCKVRTLNSSGPLVPGEQIIFSLVCGICLDFIYYLLSSLLLPLAEHRSLLLHRIDWRAGARFTQVGLFFSLFCTKCERQDVCMLNSSPAILCQRWKKILSTYPVYITC